MRKLLLFTICISIISYSCERVKNPQEFDSISPYIDNGELEYIPTVRITQKDYPQENFLHNSPDTTIFKSFCKFYGGKYSDGLKDSIVYYLKQKVNSFGEDSTKFKECIVATGLLKDGITSLPYLAEKAKYNGKEAWRIEFAWGWLTGLGHYKCFVMDETNQDTLFYRTCK